MAMEFSGKKGRADTTVNLKGTKKIQGERGQKDTEVHCIHKIKEYSDTFSCNYDFDMSQL